MAIIKNLDGKIRINQAGEVATDVSTDVSKKLLHIDFDTQLPNRVLKDDSNVIKQVTDKAENRAIVATGSPTFNYNAGKPYAALDGASDYFSGKGFDLPSDFTIFLKVDLSNNTNGISLINCDGSTRGWNIFLYTSGALHLYNGSTLGGVWGIATLSTTGTNYIVLSYDSTLDQTACVVFNDEVYSGYVHKQNQSFASSFPSNGNDLNILRHGYSGALVESNLYTVQIFDGSLDYLFAQTTGTYIENTFNWDFNYIKRYKSDGYKQLFLTSTYLKDCDIDSSTNKIAKLNSCFGDYYLAQGTDSKRPILTSKGIYLATATETVMSFTNGNADTFHLLDNDFIFNFPFYIPSGLSSGNYPIIHQRGTANEAFLFLYDYTNSRFAFLSSSDGTTFDVDTRGVADFDVPKDTFNNISIIRYGDVLYFYANGVLKSKYTLTTGYSIFQSSQYLKIGRDTSGNPIGYIDDILAAIGSSLITPSGTIDRTDFERLRRRCFDSRFIQF